MLFFEEAAFFLITLNIIAMKNVTLQFPSTHILWLFRRTMNLLSLQVNPALKRLRCECKVEDINIAVSTYGAEIIEINNPLGLRNNLGND